MAAYVVIVAAVTVATVATVAAIMIRRANVRVKVRMICPVVSCTNIQVVSIVISSIYGSIIARMEIPIITGIISRIISTAAA